MTGIRIESVGQMSDFDRIHAEIKALINSVEGTIPGYRAFGMSANTPDVLQPDALNEFSRDLDEKLEEFIPEIQVENVKIAKQNADGKTELDIQISQSDLGEVDEE